MNDETKWRAIFLKKEGKLSNRQIAACYKVSPSTVTNLWEKYNETGSMNERNDRQTGAARKTTPRQDRALVHASIDNLRNGLETQAKVYATSVIRFTLEPCNFTLNTFQDSVFTYFKQEQKCECNYRLLKLFREINKAENHHLMFP